MSRFLVPKRVLAQILSTTERTLTAWQAEGMPIAKPGTVRGQENRYDAAVCVRWARDREIEKLRLERPRDTLDRVRAQREELALAKDRDELVDVKELGPELDRWVSDAVAVLEALPDKYCEPMEQTDGAEGKRQLLCQMIYEIRETLGTHGQALDGSTRKSAA